MKRTACWLIILLVTITGFVRADEAQLDNIIVTNTRDDLLLYLNAANAFSEELTTTIQSGAAITFTYYIRLDRIQSFWQNQSISTLNITHTIEYNTLKDEYVVTRSWEKQSHTVKQFDSARKLMTTVTSLVITPLSKLTKDQQTAINSELARSRGIRLSN